MRIIGTSYELWKQNFVRGGGHSSFLFDKISSLSNIFRAWSEFKRGKIQKQDVSEFSIELENAVFKLSADLQAGIYSHSSYAQFYIFDPKRRHIHKASVKDRLLHHAIFRILAPIYERKFIFDSYSSRPEKGTHKAHDRFHDFAWKLSQNNTRTVWVLKCDIRKFFDSVDHEMFLEILRKTVHDEKAMNLLSTIIRSFETRPGKGIPLGNLTSQLFSNVYLDVFDHYIKRELRIKQYIRYADDFVIMDADNGRLLEILPKISKFLKEELGLEIHPNKVHIRKFSQGIDFLGYVIFPYHRVLRTKTKQRVFKKTKLLKKALDQGFISKDSFDQSMASYYGLLEHCSGRGIKVKILSILQKKAV